MILATSLRAKLVVASRVLVDAAGMMLLILNASVVTMISIRDANAGLRKRLA